MNRPTNNSAWGRFVDMQKKEELEAQGVKPGDPRWEEIYSTPEAIATARWFEAVGDIRRLLPNPKQSQAPPSGDDPLARF
jgi:hypothetical protein